MSQTFDMLPSFYTSTLKYLVNRHVCLLNFDFVPPCLHTVLLRKHQSKKNVQGFWLLWGLSIMFRESKNEKIKKNLTRAFFVVDVFLFSPFNPKRCRGGWGGIHPMLRRSAAISQGMIQMFSKFLTFLKMMLGLG